MVKVSTSTKTTNANPLDLPEILKKQNKLKTKYTYVLFLFKLASNSKSLKKQKKATKTTNANPLDLPKLFKKKLNIFFFLN